MYTKWNSILISKRTGPTRIRQVCHFTSIELESLHGRCGLQGKHYYCRFILTTINIMSVIKCPSYPDSTFTSHLELDQVERLTQDPTIASLWRFRKTYSSQKACFFNAKYGEKCPLTFFRDDKFRVKEPFEMPRHHSASTQNIRNIDSFAEFINLVQLVS